MTRAEEQEAALVLWEHCKKFVADQQIWHSEVVYLYDRVIENAYEFIDGVCQIVGYGEPPPEDED